MAGLAKPSIGDDKGTVTEFGSEIDESHYFGRRLEIRCK